MTDFEARAPGGADAFIGCARRLPGLVPAGRAARGSAGGMQAMLAHLSRVLLADHALFTAAPCRYGGVVYRENVATKSDWYVFTIDQMTRALQQAPGGGGSGGNGAH